MISKLTPKTIIFIFIFFLILGFINQNYMKTINSKKNIKQTTQAQQQININKN